MAKGIALARMATGVLRFDMRKILSTSLHLGPSGTAEAALTLGPLIPAEIPTLHHWRLSAYRKNALRISAQPDNETLPHLYA